MKRFTATEKWDKDWFCDLSLLNKCLWTYICDRCDAAGVWDTNFRLASFQIGETVTKDNLSAFGDRVKILPNGKVWIVGFIEYQYGILSTACRPHLNVINILNKHGIEPYAKGIHTLQEKEKEKDQEKDKEKGGVGENKTPPLICVNGGESEPVQNRASGRYGDARIVLHLLNELTGRRYRETDPNLSVIAARMKEPGVDLAGVKQMLQRQVKRWKGTAQEEFLRPETLFGKSKFDSYYAARDKPIPEQNGHTTTNGAQLIIHQQELTRIEAEIKRIDNSVESHMELPPEDRAKRKQLKERREIVKRILGVHV
jgi:uncharacterized phage protein (TIGR02220 family)